MSRRAQDERDRVIGERMRKVVEKRALTRDDVMRLANERYHAGDPNAAHLLGAFASALSDEFHHRAACRSLSEAAAQDWPDAEGDFEAGATEPDELRDLLLLVSADVPLTTIKSWSPEQRDEADRWAATEHLHASDNDDVERLPMPEHVRTGRAVPA